MKGSLFVYRRIAALVALAFALSLPASVLGANAPSGTPGDAGIYTTKLANGLQVIVVEDHAAPVVQVATWYRFGSLYETPGKTGLAHALEHMLFRGTTNVSAGGLDDVTARIGAEMNGQTDYDYTQFYFTMPADKLDVGLYLAADRMHDALLRESDWKIERGAVLSEIDGDESSPFFNLLARVRAAAYPNSPNGRTPTGVRADVANATAADIAKYYREWYAPNNAALVVSGDVHHAAVFAQAKRYFGNIAPKKLPSFSLPDPKAVSGAVVDAQVPFPFEVLDLAYAIPGDTQPGEPAVSTLATLIPNQRSPFYQALVQSDIALDVEANADTQLRGGLLNVFIVLNPGHHADEAQAVFQSTVDALLRDGLSPDLARSAKALTIAQRVYSADSITGLGSLAGYTYGVVGERISDEDARLAALTPADLDAAIKTYLSKPTVVGHLTPSSGPPGGSSQKDDATASDNFSNRVPSGPIVEPAWMRTAARTPTTERSKLHPVSFTLSNGLRVLLQEKTDRPTFVLRGVIRSSPAFQAQGQEGIAELADDAADYGSANYPFAQRRKTIDDMGAYLNNGTTFGAQGMAADFDTILAILADGEMHPTFPEPWFSLERGQLANSITSENNIAGVMAKRAYKILLYAPGDPALRFPTPDTVAALSRNDLLAYTNRYWRPDLTTIVIVGDVAPDRAKAALEAAFGSWHADGPTPSTALPPIPPATAGSNYIGTAGGQVFVQLGQPAIARTSPDYDAFQLMVQILGGDGDFSSRLWQELRQKRGLVYGVSADLSANDSRGNVSVSLSAAPNNVTQSVAIVRRQLELLQRVPVSPTELVEARTRLVNSALLSEESISGQADELQDIAVNDLPLDYYQTLSQRYARVTAADIERVAKTYLHPDRLIEIFTGPRGPWSHTSL